LVADIIAEKVFDMKMIFQSFMKGIHKGFIRDS